MNLFGNERVTENIVRDQLRELGYYNSDNDIQIEEQKSNIEAVKRLLKTAGKSGKGGKGAPEFIVSALSTSDFLLIVECKADPKDHISQTCKDLLNGVEVEETDEQQNARTARFACDGALHYARFLSKDYNVIAVAVSGQTETSVLVSTFLHPKGAAWPKVLTTKDGATIDKLLSWDDYIQHGTFDPSVQRGRFDELMAFSRELHDFMRDHAKLAESEKPLLVSGTLIALRNAAFALSYSVYSPKGLAEAVARGDSGGVSEGRHSADEQGERDAAVFVHCRSSGLGKAHRCLSQRRAARVNQASARESVSVHLAVP